VCSITTNATVDGQLSRLEHSDDRQMIEDRLIYFAKEASTEVSGALDVAGMHDLPADLKDIRKKRIGRHRVYYIGHHRQCSYHTFYIKEFKKSNVDRENDSSFRIKLRRALGEPPTRELP
jgi:hypothetical protein